MNDTISSKEGRPKSFEKLVPFWGQESNDVIDQRVIEYVSETFISRRRRLLPQFIFDNESTMKLAKHLLFHKTGSKDTLYNYAESVYRFCGFLNKTPDKLVKQCLDKDEVPSRKAVLNLTHGLVDFMDYLRCQSLAPHTIANHIKALRSFFGVNGIRIGFPFMLSARSLYGVRAISPGELQKLVDVANLREKVIISIMATSGLRESTLARLRYRNVKTDIERNVIPALVSVEAEITKGKYHSYYTYLNEEAAEYLKAYVKVREIGTHGIPPEHICDESPIIRARSREIRFTNSPVIQRLIHNLLAKAGFISSNSKSLKTKRYDLAGYSLRKYFKTQLTSAGVHPDYTEFMMGHKISSYHDVKMKGTDFLRGVYLSAGLRMQPRIKLNKIDALKEIMVSWGIDPEKFLTREALAQANDAIAKEKINNFLSDKPQNGKLDEGQF